VLKIIDLVYQATVSTHMSKSTSMG
jgi:hypothetical protein